MPTDEKIDSDLDDFDEEFLKEYQKDQDVRKMYMRTDLPLGFYLMHLGAWGYLKKGVWKYQIKDFFEIPDSPFLEKDFKKGCAQIAECCGYDKKTPFRLSIISMDNLMLNFHFQKIEQKAIAQDSESILDYLVYDHQILESRIILYNLVMKNDKLL